MKLKKIIIIILILLILSAVLFLVRTRFTGHAILNEPYLVTKAICNSSNYCQDYEITCQNNEVISLKALTGAVIQHTPDWKDPRTTNAPERLCN